MEANITCKIVHGDRLMHLMQDSAGLIPAHLDYLSTMDPLEDYK